MLCAIRNAFSWMICVPVLALAFALDAAERCYDRGQSRNRPTRAPRWMWRLRGACFNTWNEAGVRRMERADEARSRRARCAS